MAAISSSLCSGLRNSSAGASACNSSNVLESFDSESVLSSGQEEKTIVSLFGWLKLRKIKTNKPPCGKHKCRGELVSDPKGVCVSLMSKEFKTELLN